MYLRNSYNSFIKTFSIGVFGDETIGTEGKVLSDHYLLFVLQTVPGNTVKIRPISAGGVQEYAFTTESMVADIL